MVGYRGTWQITSHTPRKWALFEVRAYLSESTLFFHSSHFQREIHESYLCLPQIFVNGRNEKIMSSRGHGADFSPGQSWFVSFCLPSIFFFFARFAPRHSQMIRGSTIRAIPLEILRGRGRNGKKIKKMLAVVNGKIKIWGGGRGGDGGYRQRN